MFKIRRRVKSLETLEDSILNGSPALALQTMPGPVRAASSVPAVSIARVLDIRQVPLTRPNPRRVSVLVSEDEIAPLAMSLVGNLVGLRSLAAPGADGFDEQVVELADSDVYGRGQRKWFACPGLAGRECGSRRMKLYLPPGGTAFACVDCHGITLPHTPARPLLWRGNSVRQTVLKWHEPEQLARRSA